jgi:type IV pilus assembly protein PilA
LDFFGVPAGPARTPHHLRASAPPACCYFNRLMIPKRFCIAAMVMAALVGCQKKADTSGTPAASKPVTVQVVQENERSRSFLAVNQHLELGGTLYGYVDIDGDILKLTGELQQMLQRISAVQPQVAQFANKDYSAIATTLGLTDVKALGVSSVPDGTGYFRNRAFFYTPGDRHGLLLGLGGKSGAFTHMRLAPADTAFYSEAEMDLPVVYQTIKDVVAKVAGEPVSNQMESALKQAGEKAAFSFYDLIYGLKGHASMVVRVDPEKTITMPGGGVKIPAFSMLIAIDGVAPVVERSLQNVPVFKRTDAAELHVYELSQPSPVQELQPVIVADGTTLYFATTRAFLDECRGLKTGLAQSPDFQKAVAGIGTEGNGITYVHPRMFDGLRRLQSLNPNLPQQVQSVLSIVLSKVPTTNRPMIMIRTNLPDGILVQGYWDRSFKQEVAMFSVYNPVTIGLGAAMAIPAFQKVRQSSQEKAIMNNLRQLSSAAEQYYLEHGVETVSYNALVGPEPTKYIRRIVPVAGEDYRQIKFVQGQPLRVKLPNGKVIEFAP